MRSPSVRSILTNSPNRLLRYNDLIDDYGMTYNAAYDTLHRFGIKLGGGLYIKRETLEKVLEGKPATN